MRKLNSFMALILFVGFLSIKSDIVLAVSKEMAYTTYSPIHVNGVRISCEGYKIGEYNYFKLRDLARELKGTTNEFDVEWDNEKKAIMIVEGKPYEGEREKSTAYSWQQVAYPSEASILFNGQYVKLNGYKINDNNYFKLRDLGELLSFEVRWIQEGDIIQIITSPPDNATRVSSNLRLETNAVDAYFSNFASTVKSYIINNNDRTITIVDVGEDIVVEKYDKDYNILETKNINLELPILGGFYSGEKYNYFVFGQENKEEISSKEVIKVVKYDKKFQRLSSVSIYGEESFTIEPFLAGSLKMDERDNRLVVHTSRLRYLTSDGLNHQSQLTIEIDTNDMRVRNFLGEFQANHVSHSFDQYVKFDGKDLLLLDHGDAYPRSIVLSKKIEGIYNGYEDEYYEQVDLFRIPGATGANFTGVTLGGFEISSSNYLISMNSIDHSGSGEYRHFEKEGLDKDERDIFILSVPRGNLSEYNVKQIKLASYIGSGKITTAPKLVKINNERFMVLWQEIHSDKSSVYFNELGDVKYLYVNEKGEPIGSIQTLQHFNLSDCNPIVYEDKVIWYFNDMFNNRVFYSIPSGT